MFANVPPLKEYYRRLGDKLRLGFLFIIPNIYSGSINWIQSNYKGVGLATLYQILGRNFALGCSELQCCFPASLPPVPGSTSTGHWAGHAGAQQGMNLLTAQQCLYCGVYYYIRKGHKMETGHLR